MSTNKDIYIMRGIQGSGKSTAAEVIKDWYTIGDVCRATITSADKYFTNEHTGQYDFRPNELSTAHSYSMLNFLNAIYDPAYYAVIVDNTNIALHELSPYIMVATAKGHIVKIVECRVEIKTALRRQVHNVPSNIVERKFDEFKNVVLPRHWNDYIHIWNEGLDEIIPVTR